jgi:ubiquitin-protein ligase
MFSTRRVAKEFRECSEEERSKTLGYTVSLVNDQLTHWYLTSLLFTLRNVKLFNFEDSEVKRDLRRINCDHVLLEVKFDSGYPSKPPFVRVVTPR